MYSWWIIVSFTAAVCVVADVSAQSLDHLHASSRRMLKNHSRHYIRTPDGTLWDMWGEQEYLKVFNKVVEKKPIKKRSSQGDFIEMVTIGHRWEADDTRESIAWNVPDVMHAVPDETAYYSRIYNGLPPLWRTGEGQIRPNFIYINENNRNVISEDTDARSTWVTHDLGDNLFLLEVRQGRGIGASERELASRSDGAIVVYIEKPSRVIDKGYLRGEYILWRDDSIVPPAESNEPTYRYISVRDAGVTAEELGKAVYEGDAELVTWQYKRDGRFWKWNRRTHTLRFVDVAALEKRKEEQRKRAEERSKAPKPKPTHLVILTGNVYHYGQLISENETEIRFLVLNDSMAAEMVFSKSDVVSLRETSPPPE